MTLRVAIFSSFSDIRCKFFIILVLPIFLLTIRSLLQFLSVVQNSFIKTGISFLLKIVCN